MKTAECLTKVAREHKRRIRVPSGDMDHTTPPRSPQRSTCQRQIPTVAQNLPVIRLNMLQLKHDE